MTLSRGFFHPALLTQQCGDVKSMSVSLFTVASGSPKTCCDAKQVQALDKNIKLAHQFLKHCPSCMDNFAEHFCSFTCRPDQSLFMNITQLKDNKIG